jgi:hypothetical protein
MYACMGMCVYVNDLKMSLFPCGYLDFHTYMLLGPFSVWIFGFSHIRAAWAFFRVDIWIFTYTSLENDQSSDWLGSARESRARPSSASDLVRGRPSSSELVTPPSLSELGRPRASSGQFPELLLWMLFSRCLDRYMAGWMDRCRLCVCFGLAHLCMYRCVVV